jgi:CRISPR-associated protein Csb1
MIRFVMQREGRRAMRKSPQRNRQSPHFIAALGLLALAECDAQGYALRSRCDLVCDGDAPLEFVRFDGTTERVDLDLAAARALHEAAFEAAASAGFSIDPKPLRLLPQDKLVEIVRKSQDKALRDEGGEVGEG